MTWFDPNALALLQMQLSNLPEECYVDNDPQQTEYENLLEGDPKVIWDKWQEAEEKLRLAQYALAVVQSEPFLWLMSGSNHPYLQIEALRPAWEAYKAAGGKSWPYKS